MGGAEHPHDRGAPHTLQKEFVARMAAGVPPTKCEHTAAANGASTKITRSFPSVLGCVSVYAGDYVARRALATPRQGGKEGVKHRVAGSPGNARGQAPRVVKPGGGGEEPPAQYTPHPNRAH